jgi:hypothetical protein
MSAKNNFNPKNTSIGRTGIDSILEKVEEEISVENKIKQKKQKKKLLLISSLCTLALGAIVALLIAFIIIPTIKYNNAVDLKNAGDIDAAYNIFIDLGSFKDSAKQCNEIDYSKAQKFISDGKINKAYLILSKIKEYKDCANIMYQLEDATPQLKILLSKPGDIVVFGEYEQDNNFSNGKEPIEWIVLHNDNGDIYLISKYVLDAQPFNIENLNDCSLDEWLKNSFSPAAFSKAEATLISRVGLLFENEIDQYSMTREQIKASYTTYAINQEPYRGYAAGYMWWMTTNKLVNSSGDASAPVVWENGSHYKNSCQVINRCGVRPTIWLFADPTTLPSEPVFDGSVPAGSTGGSGSGGSYCGSGSVGCRPGFHPCNPNKEGACVSCCKN